MNITIITWHYWDADRKTNFHWLANSFSEAGHKTLFWTSNFSWWSFITKKFDYRISRMFFSERNKIIEKKKNLFSFVWFTKWHPRPTRFSWISKLLHKKYLTYKNLRFTQIEEHIKSTDIFILENGCELLLFEKLKELAPSAKFIYRVSDDLKYIMHHPAVADAENKYAPLFDLISVPSRSLYEKFKNYNCKLQYHGLQKELFDKEYKNPYLKDKINIIFIGTFLFDNHFLDIISNYFPQYIFHIIGPIKSNIQKKNIVYYGSMPYNETIPYIKYANIGLLVKEFVEGGECFIDSSLKNMQYTYSKLPVIAPQYLEDKSKKHIFYYNLENPETIKIAVEKALALDVNTIDTTQINSWDELKNDMIEYLDIN